MDIETVELPAILVAGLAVRTSNENEEDPQTGLLPKTWERVGEKQYDGMSAAVLTDYESDKDGYYTEVIGHEITSLEDLQPGEVITKVAPGKYAKLTVKGEMPGIVLEAWKHVWQAETDGAINRSYTTDLERYPGPDTIELYIAIQ